MVFLLRFCIGGESKTENYKTYEDKEICIVGEPDANGVVQYCGRYAQQTTALPRPCDQAARYIRVYEQTLGRGTCAPGALSGALHLDSRAGAGAL